MKSGYKEKMIYLFFDRCNMFLFECYYRHSQ